MTLAQSSWPDPATSRAVTDTQYEQLVAAQYVDGLIGSPTDTPAVYADGTGREVTLRANRLAQLRGHGWSSGGSDTVLSIGANASGSSRTDLVVLGLSRTTWAVTAYVKPGTPGAGAPALQVDMGDTGIYEMPLAEVTVGVGVGVITADKVKARHWYARPDGVASAGVDTRPPSPTPGMKMFEDGAYVWSGTAWERISNLPTPVQTFQASDLLGSADITGDGAWHDVPDAAWPSLVFVVPASGRVRITVSGWAEHHLTTSSAIWVSYRASGGGMLPGTVTSEVNKRGLSTRGGRIVTSKTRLFTGLVPGASVSLIPIYQSSAPSSDANVTSIRQCYLTMEPVA
jgi:hypothetical protein